MSPTLALLAKLLDLPSLDESTTVFIRADGREITAGEVAVALDADRDAHARQLLNARQLWSDLTKTETSGAPARQWIVSYQDFKNLIERLTGGLA